MLKSFMAAIGAATLGFATPALAARPTASWSQINELVERVQKTGTVVNMAVCDRPGIAGFYHYDPTQTPIKDELRVCTNTTNMSNPDEVWEVVVHESAHVMQACFADNIVKEQHHPELLAELKLKSPSTVRILTTQYPASQYEIELEAFWMEFQSPSFALNMMDRYCGKLYN
jgi:hypothetical protein